LEKLREEKILQLEEGETLMEKVLDFLSKNPVGGMATVADGKPDIRTFMLLAIEDEKIYFATGSSKQVYKQIMETPHVAFASGAGVVTVRLSSSVTFVDDHNVRSRLLEQNAIVKKIYGSSDNPELKIFYLSHGHAELFDMSTMPPKRERFTF